MNYRTVVDSIKNLIFNPKQTWPQISAKPVSNKEIFLSVVLPLTLTAAVISLLVIWLGTYLSFGLALKIALLRLVLPIVAIIATAIITNELAGSFNSAKDLTASFKLISYSATPWLIANIIASFALSLSWVTIFGLYGIYLLYTGLPVMMQTSEDKKPVYTLVVVVIIFVVQLILSAIFNIDRIYW